MRVREEARPVIATVDPADIRGLVTTLLTFVGRLPRSRHEGRPKPPHNAAEGCAKPRPRLLPDPAELSVCSSDSDRHLPRDRPEEREDLARDGRDNDIRVLPACDHAAVPLAQPHLRLPRDFLNRLRALFDPLLQGKRPAFPGGALRSGGWCRHTRMGSQSETGWTPTRRKGVWATGGRSRSGIRALRIDSWVGKRTAVTITARTTAPGGFPT